MTNLTNMMWGALGALVALTLIPLLRLFGRLQLGTRVGNALYRLLRTTLGMQHFEKLVINELRTYRSDVDRLTRDTNSDVRRVRNEVNVLADAHRARSTKVMRLQREVEELGLLLRQYADALGPIWTTAQGHQMPLRLLSTSHLRNIKEGNFGSMSVRDFVDRELERREIDSQWRAREAAGLPAPTRQDVIEKGLGVLDPRVPFAYSPEVATRVTRTLPLWARELISDLLVQNPRSLTREELRRVRQVLPAWAQQLVADLRRPR